MVALLIMLYLALNQLEAVIVRRYGKKQSSGGMFFNAIICLFSMVFFFVTDENGLCFPKELWGYGIVSCLMFAVGFYTMYAALKIGSFVITRLVSSFSGVIAICYGIFFLKEPSSITTYIGIVLVFVSMFLMKYDKNAAKSEQDKAFSVKWLIYVILVAVSNGLISVISREQQLRFNNAYDNEFMIMSFGGAFIALVILGFIFEKEHFKQTAKYGTVYGFLGGLFNGSKNFVSLLLYPLVPISILTPIYTGLGFIVSFLMSVFLYKEKFTKRQLISAALGIVALMMFKA